MRLIKERGPSLAMWRKLFGGVDLRSRDLVCHKLRECCKGSSRLLGKNQQKLTILSDEQSRLSTIVFCSIYLSIYAHLDLDSSRLNCAIAICRNQHDCKAYMWSDLLWRVASRKYSPHGCFSNYKSQKGSRPSASLSTQDQPSAIQ